MIKIYNSLLPLKGYWILNLCGVYLIRKDVKMPLTPEVINHEEIHTAQMKELLYVGFYIAYLVEWMVRWTRKKSWYKAYLDLSFEKEAYRNQDNLHYLQQRRHFAMWH